MALPLWLWLVPCWYGASLEAGTSLKAWFKLHHPQDAHNMGILNSTASWRQLAGISLWLFLGQALAGLIVCAWLSRVQLSRLAVSPSSNTPAGRTGLLAIHSAAPALFWATTVLGVIGTASGYLLLRQGSLGLLQLLRCFSPVLTAIIATSVLGERLTKTAWMLLLVSVSGVIMAVWPEPTFSFATAALGALTNVCLCLRNVLVKRVLEQCHPQQHSLTKGQQGADGHARFATVIVLFTAVGVVGAAVMAVALFFMAGSLQGLPGISLVPQRRVARVLLQPNPVSASGTATITAPVTWLWAPSITAATYNTVDTLLVKATLCNFLYMATSQVVLSLVPASSHGVLELFKRVFVLLLAGGLGDNALSWIGAVISTAATTAFFYERHTRHRHGGTCAGSESHQHRADGVNCDPALHAHRQQSSGSSTRKIVGLDAPAEEQPPLGNHVADTDGTHARRGSDSRCSSPLPLLPSTNHDVIKRATSIALWILWVAAVLVLLMHRGSGSLVQGISHLTQQQAGLQWLGSSSNDSHGEHLHSSSSSASGSQLTGGGSGMALTGPPGEQQHVRHQNAVGKDPVSVPPAENLKLPAVKSATIDDDRLLRHSIAASSPHDQQQQQAGAAGAAVPALTPTALGATPETSTASQGPLVTEDGRGSVRPAAKRAQEQAVRKPHGVLAGIYVGWLDHNNMGDDLLEDIFLKLLADAFTSLTHTPTVVQLRHHDKLKSRCAVSSARSCHFGVWGGGSLLTNGYAVPFQEYQQQGKGKDQPRPLLLFGTGMQYKEHSKKVCHTLRAATLFGGVRGADTQQGLRRLCPSLPPVPIVYDSGFFAASLLNSMTAEQALQEVDVQPGVPLVVVTLKQVPDSPHLDKFGNFTPGQYQTADQVEMMSQLAATHQVVLQPTDPHNAQWFTEFAAHVNAQLPSSARPIKVQLNYMSFDLVLALYRAADFAISQRLHPAIMAASAGTPFLVHGVNMKLRDAAASVGLAASFFSANPQDKGTTAAFRQAVRDWSQWPRNSSERAQLSQQLQGHTSRALQLHSQAMKDMLDHMRGRHVDAFSRVERCTTAVVARRSIAVRGRSRTIELACEPHADAA